MAGYSPLKITGMATGLVQERENFLLPDDAYPVLQNAYVWRERILRKRGYQLLGRLQRSFTVSTSLSSNSVNLISALGLESTSTIVPGSINLVGGTDSTTYTDPGLNGVLTATGGSGTGGSINYATGLLTITAGGAEAITGTIQYYPGLPVMGIRIRELQNSANDQTIFFDQKYAYDFNSGTNTFEEFIPGTTWNAANLNVSGTNFFWSTNYWTSDVATFGAGTTVGTKLFWETNGSGAAGNNADPPRITDGISWVNFDSSTWNQIDATTFLYNWLCNLPYRGRMVVCGTYEGTTKGGAKSFSNRIRWSTIGNPFIPYHNTTGPTDPSVGSWRDDIRGQGGFLDISTSEDIISIGFVRDNLVIYCERSTWQLRYTGRSTSPFQIEKVNSELGTESTFSSVQFDTSLVGIGDKGIVECDSYKSERIDIKIPDLVFNLNSLNNGVSRVQGIRDFPNRLAYWTIPLASSFAATVPSASWIFPNQRLVYNYENDSWAFFNDSLTALGTYQTQSSRTWINTKIPWIECDFPWINQPQEYPSIVGGNQQGFIEYLNYADKTTNDVSMYISAITQSASIVITSPNHNMSTGFVIGISGIPAGTPFSSLNGGIYGIIVSNANQFSIYTFNATANAFNIDVTGSPSGIYVGSGLINIRENFSIVSKKFNFLDEGQNIQLGYLDILMSATGQDNPGAISLNVYLDYDDINSSNTLPKNQINGVVPPTPDTFFNSIIPTSPSTYAVASEGAKFWQRVYCATRANFLTLQYTFSNAQMAGIEQQLPVQIDAQILWIRKGGRMTQL